MKYSAIIFDLFGTLVDNPSVRDYESAVRQMVSVLTVSFDAFRRLWCETAYERDTGVIPMLHLKAALDFLPSTRSGGGKYNGR